MRKMAYLSPTSVKAFEDNPEDFYIRYLSDIRVPRPKQTQPMSIGSAFDAFVKSYLHAAIFGKGADPTYERQTLFEAQVEEHNRDWAWEHGAHAFTVYKETGALADLVMELSAAVGKPRFEISIEGLVSSPDAIQTDVNDVTLLGKPDLFFLNKAGHSVILDWKVNGWCSKSGHSPRKGYIRLLDENKKIKGPHKDAHVMMHNGMMINIAHFLEEIDKDWAGQLACYGWLCGEEIGNEFITCIDQIVCAPSGAKYPKIRVAQHRVRVSKKFQEEWFKRICYVWNVVNSDYIFRNISRLESVERCRTLDAKARDLQKMLESDNPDDNLFLEMSNVL